jgi:hypothetical protein
MYLKTSTPYIHLYLPWPQVTPLTKEHTKEVADLFSPTKAAERASADTNATLTKASGDAGELRPVDSMYALGDCCANMGK